ncbi:FecR family protein [Bacteroides neonati]|uniref:FecR family protein n=1 Tax=Bacteroides neonati TaxID=1347393 RepID=UPI0004BA44E2|nr:FecR family protein [Bacteroides neonati]
MDNIAALIKKMLVRGLNSSEKIHLSEQQPMKELLSRQWEEKTDKHILEKVDSSVIWKNITTVCWEKNAPAITKPTNKTRLIRLGTATAAAVAILLVGLWIANVMTDSYMTVTAPLDSKMALVLPDSSTVWVNAGTTLRYKKDFREDRRVLLDGEAFFDVVKMPSSPFRVYFNGSCVEVKGTVFTIKSEQKKAEVILFSGKVAFTPPESETAVEMKPSDRIVYDAVNKNVMLTHVDAVEYDWRSSEYRFVDKPLGELISFLNRTYKIDIVLKNTDYEKSKFSGVIRKGEPLEDILDKVCFTFDLKRKKSNKYVTLY